jgi:hypothetical protein
MTMTTTTTRATGNTAIDLAEALGLGTVQKHADPIDGARSVGVREARDIAAVDASLIYLDLQAVAPLMDDGIRETVHAEGHETADAFAARYVELAPRG